MKTQKFKKNKKLLKIVITIVIMILLFTAFIAILFMVNNNTSELNLRYNNALNNTLPTYSYPFQPDFEENIWEDKSYISMDLSVKFTDGSQSIRFQLEDDMSKYGNDVVFFQKYFIAVINGDLESYLLFFSDAYENDENNLPLPDEDFTMQKIYGIEIVKKSAGSDDAYYTVDYKFKENNGTFRNDIRDGDSRPFTFKLTTENDKLKITQIKPTVELTY